MMAERIELTESEKQMLLDLASQAKRAGISVTGELALVINHTIEVRTNIAQQLLVMHNNRGKGLYIKPYYTRKGALKLTS